MAIHAQKGTEKPEILTADEFLAETDGENTQELVPVKKVKDSPGASRKRKVGAEMRLVQIPEEEERRIKWIEEHVIFGRVLVKYKEDLTSPEYDTPTLAFRWLIMRDSLHTFGSLCAMLGVTETTGREWMKHARFAQAVNLGKKIQEHYFATRMAQGIMYPTSLIFTMKNVFAWADKIESTHRVSVVALIADVEKKANPVDWENPDLSMIRLPSGSFKVSGEDSAGEAKIESPAVVDVLPV